MHEQADLVQSLSRYSVLFCFFCSIETGEDFSKLLGPGHRIRERHARGTADPLEDLLEAVPYHADCPRACLNICHDSFLFQSAIIVATSYFILEDRRSSAQRQDFSGLAVLDGRRCAVFMFLELSCIEYANDYVTVS